MTAKKVLVFLGSVREGRMADRVGKFVIAQLKASKPQYDVEVIDPKSLNLPVLTQAVHFYPDPSQVPPQLKSISDKIDAADGFILITPEYNRQIAPAITNTLNHFAPQVYAFKPAGIVTYSRGLFGGVIAGHQALSYMVKFGAVPAAATVHIGHVDKSITPEGIFPDSLKCVTTYILYRKYGN